MDQEKERDITTIREAEKLSVERGEKANQEGNRGSKKNEKDGGKEGLKKEIKKVGLMLGN